jgi:hypothetical protein
MASALACSGGEIAGKGPGGSDGLGSGGGGAANGGGAGGSSGTVPNSGGATNTGGDRGAGGGIIDASGPGAGGVSGNGGSAADAAPPRRDGAARDAASTETGTVGLPAGDGGARPYRGVANSACADLPTIGASWYYNWKQSPDSNCKNSQFVPMIWGHTGNEQSATGIANAVTSFVNAGYQYVLGFNEPDNTTQANIPVATAISLWPSFNNAAIRIGSPATQANTTGMAWFATGTQPTFMGQVNADTTGSLRVDFIAAHWYGWNAGSCEPNAQTFEAYLRQIEAIPGNRPIWITEFGCLNQSAPTAQVVETFLSGAIAMLARHPRVERYAWYPWIDTHALVDANGALTPLGAIFAAAPATR